MKRNSLTISTASLILAVLLIPLIGSPQGGEELYERARAEYHRFWVDEDAKAERANWLKVISSFEEVYRTSPDSPAAPKAYYMAGKLSYYAFKYHRNCLLYTSPSPRDLSTSRMPSSA